VAVTVAKVFHLADTRTFEAMVGLTVVEETFKCDSRHWAVELRRTRSRRCPSRARLTVRR
jgi:hypothetical protein